MSTVIELSEGMRIGIPFRAQKTIDIDKARFAEYEYEFPTQTNITLIETADDIGTLNGYFGDAIAEVTNLSQTAGEYQFVSLMIIEVEIEGKLSITREEQSTGMRANSEADVVYDGVNDSFRYENTE